MTTPTTTDDLLPPSLRHGAIMTAEQVRGCLEAIERTFARERARVPKLARFFPPITDAQFRTVLELALLGEIRRPFVLHAVLSAAQAGD
jgi:hypothetical protein